MKHPILRHIPGARQWIEKMERLERERIRLTGKLEKLQAQLAATQEVTPRRVRSDYKAVWTDLSRTTGSANWYVGGVDEEEWFETTGVVTKESLLSSVNIGERDTVVEIGCGVGRVGRQLAPICQRWIGCDVSPNMVDLAARRLERFDNVEIHEVSGFSLAPLGDASADVVYSTIVFMHLEEWDRYNYVLEAYRVLKPSGRIYIDNVNLCCDLGWNVFEEHRQIPADQRPPHITKHSTESELRTYLERAGFKEIHGGRWISSSRFGEQNRIVPAKLPSQHFDPLRYGVGGWTGHIFFAYDLVAQSRPRLLVESTAEAVATWLKALLTNDQLRKRLISNGLAGRRG